MKKVRKVAALLLAAVMVMSLAGCSKKEEKPAAADTSAETKTEAPKAAESTDAANNQADAAGSDLTAEITWWNFPNFTTVDDTLGKYEEGIIAAFNEKYPNIKVNLEMIDFTSGPEKITNAIQGGTICDVLFDAPGRIIQYGKDGVLADLSDMFTDEFIADVNNENVINACKAGDSYWMYPISTAPFLMAVNKTMLEEHGLMEYINLEGDRSWTMDQFKGLLQGLKDKGERGPVIFCSSQGGDQGTRAFLANISGVPVVKEDMSEYTLNDPKAVEALQWLCDAIKEGLVVNGTASDGTAAIDEFCTGTVGATILYSGALQGTRADQLKENGIETVLLPFPTPEGVDPALEYLIDGFCVFDKGDANKIEASKLLIDFICNDPEWGPKNVIQTNTFPARTSYGNLYEGDETMTYLAGLTKYYSPYYNTIDGFAEMRTIWFPTLQAAFAGEKTPQQALDDFVAGANESIKKAQQE